MQVEQLALSYQGQEKAWIEELVQFSKESGRAIESVLVQAAIEAHREAVVNAVAFDNARNTATELARELRDLNGK